MKTIKQKILHSKLSVIAVLFFALILLVSGGLMTKKASAETTFSEADFKMCVGAEVRTDGKDGIRFVASLGVAEPSETVYKDLTCNVMIVPKVYLTHYGITSNYFTELQTALKNDGKSTYIATMPAKPFYSNEVVAGEEGYYIRGTLSNVKYDNINVDWFGMAYLTYTDDAGATQYVYAKIPEDGANVRSLVYCASAYLNLPQYADNATLKKFVAQGINKKNNVAEADKDDEESLKNTIDAFEQSVSENVNLNPNATAKWEAPAGLQAVYASTDASYASIDASGVITGGVGDNKADTIKYVTMTLLGKTYQKPVHVYTITATLENQVQEIFTKDEFIGDTTFVNSAQLTVVAEVDGKPTEETLAWTNSNTGVATVDNNGLVTAVENNAFFESETVNVSFSFEHKGEEFESNEVSVTVSFPIAYKTAPKDYGDLMQNVFNSGSTALETTTDAINTEVLGVDFGNVTSFRSEDGAKELLVDGEQATDANRYGAKEAGEKNFVVVSENGYGYMVKATVVNYAISNVKELDYFFGTYQSGASGNNSSNVTYGTYVILSGDVTGYTYYVALHANQETNNTYYRGTFDGRGHKITIDTSAKKYCRQGFFGRYLGSGAVIKNLAIINYMKNSVEGGGFAKWLAKTAKIDNCFLQLITYATTKEMGGIAHDANGASITNTIVKVSYSASTNASNKSTICFANGDNVQNCYSIGYKNDSGTELVNQSVGTSTENVYFSNNELLAKVISDNKPISGFNEYWKSTTEGLMFGDNLVLTYTTTTA